MSAESNLRVRALLPDERPWLERQLARLWGSPHVVSRGHLHDASSLPALVCLDRHDPVGFATFDVRRQQCELVTLDAFVDGHGIGSALLDAVAEEARRQGCGRLWLITTNDNLRALRFYQRRGLRLVAVHRGAVDDARRVKPSIPLVGEHGIPIHDELELELELELRSTDRFSEPMPRQGGAGLRGAGGAERADPRLSRGAKPAHMISPTM